MSVEPNSWQPSGSIENLKQRAYWLNHIRQYFAQQGVLEVHTPLLGECTVTDPDAEGIVVPGYGFLQTSPEYFLKRLLVAGMPDCYQLAPAYRAGEEGRLHNPEFLMLEWYRLNYDHHQLMQEVAELVNLVLGDEDYRTVTYAELVAPLPLTAPRDQLDLEFAQQCKKLKGRTFITHYPSDQAVLARIDGETSARFELVIDGVELANGYWELQDPDEHAQRFEADLTIRQQRGLEQPQPDQKFLQALQQGLPNCAGVALGLDRLFMVALEAHKLDDVITFRR